MRVRIYSPYFPHPVSEGAFQVILEQVRGFARHHQVQLICWKGPVPQVKAGFLGPNVEIIWWGPENSDLPAGLKESSSDRLKRTLGSIFKSESSPGLFYYPLESDRRSELSPCELAVYHYTYAWNWLQPKLNSKTKSLEPKQVVYFHNIESDLFQYRALCEKNPIFSWIHKRNAKKLFKQEKQLVNLVQECWHISPRDFNDTVLRGIGMNMEQSVRVPIYSKEYFQARSESFLKQYRPENPVVLGFIGGLDFDANRDSLNWILDQVCPGLQKGGFKGRLEVVGRNAPEQLLQKMKIYPFIYYEGFRASLDGFWNQMSVMLVPHVSGSGVRIKLLDSLGSGIPALANDQVVERIHPELMDSPFLIEDSDPQSWVETILKLEGQKLRFQLQEKGLDLAHQFESVYPEFVPGSPPGKGPSQ